MALTTIRLEGDLAEKFTPELQADVSSVRDAIDVLQANYSDFRSYLIQSDEFGYGYHVFIGDWNIEQKDIFSPVGTQTIVIIPVVAGAGGNFGKIILGVGLIAVGVMTGGVGFISASTLILTGATMALSGIVGLFATPQNNKEEDEKKNSLLFGNSINAATTGGRLAVVYGRIECTSMVLSASIRSYLVEDDSDEES